MRDVAFPLSGCDIGMARFPIGCVSHLYPSFFDLTSFRSDYFIFVFIFDLVFSGIHSFGNGVDNYSSGIDREFNSRFSEYRSLLAGNVLYVCFFGKAKDKTYYLSGSIALSFQRIDLYGRIRMESYYYGRSFGPTRYGYRCYDSWSSRLYSSSPFAGMDVNCRSHIIRFWIVIEKGWKI